MIRALKVYIFVFGLILLGAAFKPVVDRFISDVPFSVLYWINILSAVLDNATMAAAEIGPSMSLIQIKAAILAMIVSGGMMIPGNIPNIITAGKARHPDSGMGTARNSVRNRPAGDFLPYSDRHSLIDITCHRFE